MKGYISVDFLLSTFIFLIILGSLITIVEGRLNLVQTTEEAAEERMIVEMVANIIDSTYSAGEGHEMRITMPASIKGSAIGGSAVKSSDYVLKIRESQILIQVGGKEGQSFIHLNGQMEESEVLLFPNRTYIFRNIKNQNGYSFISIKQVS